MTKMLHIKGGMIFNLILLHKYQTYRYIYDLLLHHVFDTEKLVNTFTQQNNVKTLLFRDYLSRFTKQKSVRQ